MAEATSKRIEAENNLDISISEFKKIVGRSPNVNWYDSEDVNIIKSNPKDWSKFGLIPKIPSTLDDALQTGLKNNPEYLKLQI